MGVCVCREEVLDADLEGVFRVTDVAGGGVLPHLRRGDVLQGQGRLRGPRAPAAHPQQTRGLLLQTQPRLPGRIPPLPRLVSQCLQCIQPTSSQLYRTVKKKWD